MLSRDQALLHLNLPQEATREEIEKSYRRLVSRYPPEYHPDRFRLIDESYRTLTSLSYVVETILTDRDQGEDGNLAQRLAEVTLSVDADAVSQGVDGLRRILLCDALWPHGGSSR